MFLNNISVDITLWSLGLQKCLSAFSTVNYFFLSFYIVLFGRKLLHSYFEVTMLSPHLRNWQICSTSLSMEYIAINLYQYLWIFHVYAYSWIFIHGYLFCIHGYLFCIDTLGCSPILLYVFFCLNCFNFGPWDLFQLAPVSL